MAEQNNSKALTQELQSAVKTIKVAILLSQVRAAQMMKGFSEESIKLMRLSMRFGKILKLNR
ncbi:MAG: hypothetical protein IJT98_03630 [Prevotella sp.]|nr:hypothetical protein [Prevotella sp.]